MARARALFLIAWPLALLLPSAPAAAQPEPSGRAEAVRVFLDCPACDQSYVRSEITFVNYVRDRTAADVHVLVTSQGTGGGGTLYSVGFIGLGRFKGVDNALAFTAPQGATPDERRRGIVGVLKLGLVRYVADSPVASQLSVLFEDTPHGRAPAAPLHDPWNFWVFRFAGSGGVDGEQSATVRNVSGSLSASRTTDAWKLIFNGGANYRTQRFELEGNETFTALRRGTDWRGLVTRSLTPHWSAGATGAISASTFANYDVRTRVGPAVEYNVFPYAESNRRILTVLYTVGLQTADYTEVTIDGKLSERLVDQQLEIGLGLRQPWGTASAAFETSQYLNRRRRYRVGAFGGLDVRLFRGFSVSLDGRLSRRRDQLSLRRGTATTEEILVRQHELATDYSYDFGFGISYSFGSLFNSVVNPRFRGAGGF